MHAHSHSGLLFGERAFGKVDCTLVLRLMRLTGPRRVHTICRAEEQGLVRWAATSVRLTFGKRSTKGGRRIYVVPSPDGIVWCWVSNGIIVIKVALYFPIRHSEGNDTRWAIEYYSYTTANCLLNPVTQLFA